MTRLQRMKKLQSRLLERRKELRCKFFGTMDDLENDLGSGDEADAASYNTSSELHSKLASLESDELREVELALSRFANGRFGICEISGKSIPIERLEALPFARVTVEAQRQVEANGNRKPIKVKGTNWETAIAHENRSQEREISWRDIPTDD
jgi:DnaK suppressor protein